jgi:hypothetical protein
LIDLAKSGHQNTIFRAPSKIITDICAAICDQFGCGFSCAAGCGCDRWLLTSGRVGRVEFAAGPDVLSLAAQSAEFARKVTEPC